MLSEKHALLVFKNWVLWRIFGPKRQDARRICRISHNEVLHASHSWLHITRTIKSRLILLAGHVARIDEKRNHTGFFFLGKLRKEDTT
jgi:hypothetical protein